MPAWALVDSYALRLLLLLPQWAQPQRILYLVLTSVFNYIDSNRKVIDKTLLNFLIL